MNLSAQNLLILAAVAGAVWYVYKRKPAAMVTTTGQTGAVRASDPPRSAQELAYLAGSAAGDGS